MQLSLDFNVKSRIGCEPITILLCWEFKNWFIEKLKFKLYETDLEFSTFQPELFCDQVYYGAIFQNPERKAWQVIQVEMCYLKHSGCGMPLGAKPLLRAKALLTKNRAKILFEEPAVAFAKGDIFADLTWYYSKLKYFIKDLWPCDLDWKMKHSDDSISAERLEV